MSDEEYERMPARIEGAFDHVRELMAEELGGDPEDHEPNDLSQKLEK